MLKRILASTLAFTLLSGPLWAQPAPAKLGVLTLDAEQRWDPDTQAHWQAPGDAAGQPVGDAGKLLNSQVVQRMSFEQRKILLRDPARLLSCDRAPEIFAVDRVLLLEPAVEERVQGHYLDLRSGLYRRLLSKRDQSAEEGRAELVALARNPYGPYSVPVFANPSSMLYHQMDSDHVNSTTPREDFPSFYLAEARGFTACAVCFAGFNRDVSKDALELKLGQALAARMEQQFRPSQEAPYNERVQRVGHELLTRNRLGDQGYRFVVLESDSINAFAVPTGPLYITTGLLNVVESDAELAAILGHELAHSELHHGRRQYEQYQQLSWLSLLATVATGSQWIYLASSFMGTLWTSGYSREFELEADRQGLWYTFGAGYQPGDFRLTLRKFYELEKSHPRGGLSWLHTHPGSLDRIHEVDQILDRLEPLGLVLEEVEPQDPGLASYLKRHGSDFLDKPEEVVAFLGAYRGLNLPARSARGPSVTPIAPLPQLK